jgi:type VI protein secretion system component Hcp
MEACALGKFNKKVVVEFTTLAAGREVPYLTYEFHNLAFASYAVHADSSGPAKTTET